MLCAVLFSPGAGHREQFSSIGQQLQQLFGPENIITGFDSFGADYLPQSNVCCASREGGYVHSITAMTEALIDKQVDLIVSVGGDGLASYVADAMLCAGKSVPIMGIAAGTANVGPIVCISQDMLDKIDVSKWKCKKVSAIEVSASEHLGYAVNDVVIGNTLLGTVDGNIVNLSAEAMVMLGRKVICVPSADITLPGFSILKNGRECRHDIIKPGQIIATTLDEDRLEGRAIYGALCSAAYTPCKGALALTEQVMICAEAENAGMRDFCPIEHLLYGPGDEVVLDGLSENAHAIIDGNPYVHKSSRLTLRYLPEVITVAIPGIIGG